LICVTQVRAAMACNADSVAAETHREMRILRKYQPKRHFKMQYERYLLDTRAGTWYSPPG
jgi:hypothetical protein